MSEDEQVPVEFGLLEPFVVCASRGGAYDDDSFTAGVIYAQIAADLSIGAPAPSYTVPPALVAQVDLNAMRHGYTVTSEPWEDGQDYMILTMTAVDPTADASGVD